MIKLPEGVNLDDDRSVEHKYHSAVAGLARRVRLLYDGIIDRFGDEGVDMIESTSRSYGEEIAERAKDFVKEGDVRSVANFVIRIFNTIDGEGEVTEYTQDRVVIRVFHCPYLFEQPKVCRAHTEMERALVESFGEKIRYEIERSIPGGDSYCDHVIKKVP